MIGSLNKIPLFQLDQQTSPKNSQYKHPKRLIKWPSMGSAEKQLMQKKQSPSYEVPIVPKDLFKRRHLREQISKSKPLNVYSEAQQDIQKPTISLKDIVTRAERTMNTARNDTEISGECHLKTQKLPPSRQITLTERQDRSDSVPFAFNGLIGNLGNSQKQLFLSEIPKQSRSNSVANQLSQKSIFNTRYYLPIIQQAFKKKYSIDKNVRIAKEHFIQSHQGLKLKLQPMGQLFYPEIPKMNDSYKITVIFDLDETLVHCNDNITTQCDVLLGIPINQGKEQILAGVNIRPYVQEVISRLSEKFELMVFTASHSCYAEEVINFLDPEKKIFKMRLFREHCTQTNLGLFTKDLSVLTKDNQRSLNKIVLVDNATYSFNLQVDNGIPILPFYDQKDDKQLLDLEQYLLGMIGYSDVRQYNRENLKLSNIIKHDSYQQAYEELFGTQIS